VVGEKNKREREKERKKRKEGQLEEKDVAYDLL
jgi:hypothetical protein